MKSLRSFNDSNKKEDKNIDVDPKLMRLRDSVAISGYREPYTIYLDNQVRRSSCYFSCFRN